MNNQTTDSSLIRTPEKATCPHCNAISPDYCRQPPCQWQQDEDQEAQNSSTEAPWCVLCGQRHAWGTSCDPQRIDELRKNVAKMASDYGRYGFYHTSSTTFIRMATPYLHEENPND